MLPVEPNLTASHAGNVQQVLDHQIKVFHLLIDEVDVVTRGLVRGDAVQGVRIVDYRQRAA